MILRRFMKHFTDQNWFAVGLDVIVVIVGIFLGLQVQAWYEGRAAEIQQRIYLDRIRTEIIDTLPLTQQRFEEQDNYLRLIHDVTLYVSNTKTDIALTLEHCRAIRRSHVLVNNAPDLTSMAELINTGQLANIKNMRLKDLIAQYIRVKNRYETRTSGQVITARRLLIDFPELMSAIGKIRPDDTGTNLMGSVTQYNEYQCDFEMMKESVAFRNSLISNDTGFIAYVRSLYSLIQQLKEILTELNNELDITHEDNAP